MPARIAIVRTGPRNACPVRWCCRHPKQFVCLGCHLSTQEMLRRVPREKPDLLILDTAVLNGGGFRPVSLVRRVVPEIPVLVISKRSDAPTVLSALINGATGYLLKGAQRGQSRIIVDPAWLIVGGA